MQEHVSQQDNIIENKKAYKHLVGITGTEFVKQTTRKRFSEKTIVAFTNSTVFILDFYLYN